jgi:hypothetical protein
LDEAIGNSLIVSAICTDCLTTRCFPNWIPCQLCRVLQEFLQLWEFSQNCTRYI